MGYAGGEVENPTYENHKGHAEVIQSRLHYDSNIVSFKELLDLFFRVHNPTTLNRQGNDYRGFLSFSYFYQTKKN